MSGTTARLGLPYPTPTDDVSGFPAVSVEQMDALDSAVRYFSGTLSNRATVDPSLTAGDLYYATDTELLYEYNGSAWGTVMIAGAWQNLSLTTGFTDASGGSDPPAMRQVGDMIQCRGTASYSGSGGSQVLANATVVPSGFRSIALAYPGGSTAGLTINHTVPNHITVTVSTSDAVILEGLSCAM